MKQTAALSFVALAVWLCGCASFKDKPLVPAKTATDFEARSLSDEGLRRFIEVHRRGKAAAWDLPALTLAALYFHPDMDVARARWGAADAGKVTAGQRPNPTVSVSPAYDTTTSIPSPWIVTASFDIPIETAGKRGYRIAQAAHLSEAARLNIATAAWQVRSRVRSRLLELYTATRNEELSRQQEAAQARVVKLLKAQLDAGAVSPFEVTQAQIAQRNASLALNETQRQRAEGHVALADALGVPARALDGVAISFAGLDEKPGANLASADARRQAMLGRADIRGALAEYAASQSALQLEIAKQWPDVHLGPGYEYDQGDSKWSVGLSVELPMLNQNQGGIAEAKGRREVAAAQFMALQARVVGEIDRAMAGYEAALKKATTVAALLADQRRQRQTAQRMFEAGETGRLALATAELEIFTTELSRLDAIVKAQQALGALEDAVQQPTDMPAVSPEVSPRKEPQGAAELPLRFGQSIPLAHVKGGFDLMAVDLSGKRLFLNAEDNSTTEVIDLAAGKLARTIGGMSEPKWVVYRPELNKLFVANGDGRVRVLDARTFEPRGVIEFKEKANNLRFDAKTGELFVGVGKTYGAIGVVDTRSDAVTAQIPLANYPKQFEVEGNLIYVNVPEANHIAVVDRAKKAVVATWPVTAAKGNVPMGFDRQRHRLFIGCEPGKLVVVDSTNGRQVAALDIAPEPDGVHYDARRQRIYVSCGDGCVDVLQQVDADHYEFADRVPTAKGAATSLFVPELDQLFVAVPQRDGQGAELRVFHANAP